MSDVRLICNSSSFLLRQMSGCVKLQEDGWGRRGEGASGNNTALIIFLVFWHGDHRSRGVKKCCWHVLQWCVTSVTWSASEMKDDNMTAPLSLSLSPPIPPPPLPQILTKAFSFPIWQSLCRSAAQTFPSLIYSVRITCPSASRMRHAWGLKIKDERGREEWRTDD